MEFLGCSEQCRSGGDDIVDNYHLPSDGFHGFKHNPARSLRPIAADLMLARHPAQKSAHSTLRVDRHFCGDHLGLIKAPLTHPICGRRRPGHRQCARRVPDHSIENRRHRRRKGSRRRPVPPIFQIGNEGSRSVVVANQRVHPIERGPLWQRSGCAQRSKTFLTRRTVRPPTTSATNRHPQRKEVSKDKSATTTHCRTVRTNLRANTSPTDQSLLLTRRPSASIAEGFCLPESIACARSLPQECLRA